MTRPCSLLAVAFGVAFLVGCGGGDDDAPVGKDDRNRPGNEEVAENGEPREADEGMADEGWQGLIDDTEQAKAEEDPDVLAFLETKGWKAGAFPIYGGTMIMLHPRDKQNFGEPVTLELSDFEAIGKSQTIEWLHLVDARLTAEGIAKLAGMPRLKAIGLQGETVTDEVLAAVAGIETLEIVDVMSAENTTDAGFVALAKLPRLKSLRLASCTIGPDVVPAFEEVPLTRLSLNYSKGLTDDLARQVAKITTIRELGLEEQVGFRQERTLTREGLRAVVDGFVPRKLWVHKGLIDDDILKKLVAGGWTPGDGGGATKDSVKHLNLEDTGVTDDGFSVLLECRSVTSLWLGTTKLTDASFDKFPKAFPKLNSVSVKEASVTAKGLDALAGLPIKTLYVQETKLTEEMLAAIGKLKALERLSLEGSEYESEWLRQLAGLENLTYLGLQSTAFDDTAAEHVAKLPKLEEIWVTETDLGDEGFRILVAVPQLKDLWIGETKVTADVYEKAKADNPEKSIHD